MRAPIPPEECAWNSKLDDRYVCQVQRTTPYNGVLCIFDGDKLLFEKEVGISYDAPFGADAGDVSEWEDIIINFIDKVADGTAPEADAR
jgi:hypothetical protein